MKEIIRPVQNPNSCFLNLKHFLQFQVDIPSTRWVRKVKSEKWRVKETLNVHGIALETFLPEVCVFCSQLDPVSPSSLHRCYPRTFSSLFPSNEPTASRISRLQGFTGFVLLCFVCDMVRRLVFLRLWKVVDLNIFQEQLDADSACLFKKYLSSNKFASKSRKARFF